MKKIGIIGGLSAQSTIEYYRILVYEYNKIMGGVSSPELVIDSLDLEKISLMMKNNEWENVLEELIKSTNNLLAAGAEIIIIGTNSPHKVYDELQSQFDNIEIISIMEATAKAIKEKNLSKVGLLGTQFTMKSNFYQKVLNKYNIETLLPNDEDQKVIVEILWKELTHHILKSESKEAYLQVINKLKKQGAQGIILGCTEIPLLIKQEDCDIPVFDTTYIHALVVLNKALED